METFVANLNREILNPLIFLLFALAALYLVFGIFVFVANAGNEEARAQGKRHIMYSLVGLFIMFGAMAIIGLVLNTFGISSSV
ncbi:MAG: hypothetical protein WDZ74_02320 [Candidatus Paceibacterota bacterium]